jgi:hypothetical protein
VTKASVETDPQRHTVPRSAAKGDSGACNGVRFVLKRHFGAPQASMWAL